MFNSITLEDLQKYFSSQNVYTTTFVPSYELQVRVLDLDEMNFFYAQQNITCPIQPFIGMKLDFLAFNDELEVKEILVVYDNLRVPRVRLLVDYAINPDYESFDSIKEELGKSKYWTITEIDE